MFTLKNITIIGCGVSGLSSAVRLIEAGFHVRIIARDIPPNTTSNAAGAIWYPFKCFPKEKALDWSRKTLDTFYQMMPNPKTGVHPVTFTEYFPEKVPDPWWKQAVREFRRAEPKELPDLYRDAYIFEVPFIDVPIYLPWLLNKFESDGGTIIESEISDLSEIESQADLIVNCSGLGARQVVGDDLVYPIRGQSLRVKAKSSGRHLLDQTGPLTLSYVFPRKNDYVLGGTDEVNVYHTDEDPATTEQILRKAKQLDPTLECQEILESLIGLRPARQEVRVELENCSGRCPVIHNYGHGGAGYTLSWGCADEVATLASKAIG